VVNDGSGRMRAVEAVADKDLTAALLARAIDADALLLLTDAEAVATATARHRLDHASALLDGTAGTTVVPTA
jgi:carbamate kinase